MVIGYGAAVGVLIDLDHFCIARIKTGTWSSLRFCFANPSVALTDQDQIFGRGDVGVLSRLLSHLLIAGAVVPTLALSSIPLAIVTGVVLYAHIVTDVIWDIWQLDQRSDLPADELVQSMR